VGGSHPPFPDAAFRRLSAAALHVAEGALTLHLLLQHRSGIDVVAHEDPH
jgi:hypothetical protein